MSKSGEVIEVKKSWVKVQLSNDKTFSVFPNTGDWAVGDFMPEDLVQVFEKTNENIKQQLDDLFNEWVKRDTAEVRAREELLGSKEKTALQALALLDWREEPYEQMVDLLDFHSQFKTEYAEKTHQHLVSIGAMKPERPRGSVATIRFSGKEK